MSTSPVQYIGQAPTGHQISRRRTENDGVLSGLAEVARAVDLPALDVLDDEIIKTQAFGPPRKPRGTQRRDRLGTDDPEREIVRELLGSVRIPPEHLEDLVTASQSQRTIDRDRGGSRVHALR